MPLMLLVLGALLSLLLLPACTPVDRITAPTTAHMEQPKAELATSTTGLPTGVIRVQLEHASAGLTYTSESDYPFTWYFHAGPVPSPLSIDGFRASLGIDPAEIIETRTLDDFFARHIEAVDPYDATAVAQVPSYRALRETIRKVLVDPVVFRVGRIAIDCYIVGFDRAGNLVGLTTVAIET